VNKQIIHFDQDLEKPEFYNILIKVSNIDSAELSTEIRDGLLRREFMIYYSQGDTIEAAFKNIYNEVKDKYRELEKDGWKRN
jgi:hypothetical protein